MTTNSTERHETILTNPGIDVRFYLSEDDGTYVSPHWHSWLEIIYVLEGSIRIESEGATYTIQNDELIVINSNVIHSVFSTKNKAFVLQIPETVFSMFLSNYELFYFKIDLKANSKEDLQKLRNFKQYFFNMEQIYAQKPEGYQFRFNSYLGDLIFDLIHNYSTKRISENSISNDRNLNNVKSIMKYLDRHHMQKLCIADIAEQFGYNEDYIARIFKKYVGMTIVNYLYEIRISYIYQDVVHTSKKLLDIFENHGCTNYKLTMKHFRERYKMTPKEIRLQSKQVSANIIGYSNLLFPAELD